MIGRLAAIAGAAAMAVVALGATAASASTGPGAQAPGGNTPASSSRNIYINEHGSNGDSRVKLFPKTFYLVETSYDIYATHVFWSRATARYAVAKGPMYATEENGHTSYIGDVSMTFTHELCNAHFIGSGQGYCYFENVRLNGVLPHNGGSVQHWHWSWRADNWVFTDG